MRPFHFKNKNIYIISLCIAALLLFISCSQNTPEIYSTEYSVIFDYEDDQTPPSARLSIFSSSGSEVRRYRRITITSMESGYYWDTDQITKLEADKLQWAGCTNIVAPQGENLPVGRYEITYHNADDKDFMVKLDVKYDVEFYDVLLPALADFMAEKHGIEKIAVYDKEHILIYFGDRTQEFMTTRDIWNKYREAETYQVIWYTRDGKVICVTPEKPVTPESEKEGI